MNGGRAKEKNTEQHGKKLIIGGRLIFLQLKPPIEPPGKNPNAAVQ